MNERLYRSRDDRMLAGVAGGLAELWDVDPSLIRIVWALLVLFTGGIALIVYIVMALVVPEGSAVDAGGDGADDEARAARRAARTARAGGDGDDDGRTVALIGGLVLVVLGAFFLAREFLPEIDFDWVWPAILIVVGVAVLVTALRGGRSSRRDRGTDGTGGTDGDGADGGAAP